VNTDDKTFIPNISDDDILHNRGVGLQTLSSNLSAEIKAGNYIVFQGDGELEVTAAPSPGFIKFVNISSSQKQITTSLYSISCRRTFYIEASQISNIKDDNDNYYVNFDMENIRLISAEIVNRPHEIITPEVKMYTENFPSDSSPLESKDCSGNGNG
jgi:hypothetical protein